MRDVIMKMVLGQSDAFLTNIVFIDTDFFLSISCYENH
jgi:hypothetical protein